MGDVLGTLSTSVKQPSQPQAWDPSQIILFHTYFLTYFYLFLFYLAISIYLIILHISFDLDLYVIACTLLYGKGYIRNPNIVIIILHIYCFILYVLLILLIFYLFLFYLAISIYLFYIIRFIWISHMLEIKIFLLLFYYLFWTSNF